MNKKIYFMFLIIMMSLLILPCMDVHATAQSYMFDEQGVLSDEEVSALEARLREFSEKYGIYTMVVITDNIPIANKKDDSALIDYVDLYLEKYAGKDGDGILYMIINDTQTNYYSRISTSGRAIGLFSDNAINSISDFLGKYEDSGSYVEAANLFIDLVEYYTDLVWKQHQRQRYIISSLMALFPLGGAAVGFVAWLILLGVLKFKRNIHPSKNVTGYLDKGSISFVGRRDRFIRTDVVKTRISNNNSSGGGSGGSSVHISSSGGSHGGGGRHR